MKNSAMDVNRETDSGSALRSANAKLIGRLGGQPAAAVFPNWDIEQEHFHTAYFTKVDNISVSREQHNGFHNAHTAAIELLEAYITAYETAESCNEAIVNIPPFKSCIRPNTTYLNDHARRASW